MAAASVLLSVIILIQAECYIDLRHNASDESWMRLCFSCALGRSVNEKY
jgi:hypothetical protein